MNDTLDPETREPAETPKTRLCLMCRDPFESTWAGERVCKRCKAGNTWRSGVSGERST